MLLGIDKLISTKKIMDQFEGKKLSLVAHPASVNADLRHSLQVLFDAKLNVVSAFGPQHGLRGDKQDNMIETDDFVDPHFKIPVYSLYGKSRRPTADSVKAVDAILFDLQDVGTRIYTFLTTLKYLMEACAEHGTTLCVLDRPNPAGRPIEGTLLQAGWESFVGAGPFPMRHGLTLGEAALWFKENLKIDCDLIVVKMDGYDPKKAPHFGWPANLSWVNPSPNAANANMAKCFPGTVMLEGTTISEGRGTTHPLEVAGAPDIDIEKVLKTMHDFAPSWLKGCLIRPCFFEPTFHKHAKKMCQGFQIHVDHPNYDHESFKPYRMMALFFKAIRKNYPEYQLWRDFPYEYETERLAIDLINGGPNLRNWVEDSEGKSEDFHKMCLKDERNWAKEIEKFLLY